MKSNELAKLAGVTARPLRHYHAIGLLDEPPRQANGYRDYRPEDLLRVLRIRQLASLGFPLDQVAGMLDELDAERSQREPRLPADQPTADDILAELNAALQKQIERVFNAIVDRDYVDEYRKISSAVNVLPADAPAPQRQAAVDACVGFLSKLIDCFDPQNWLRADKDYEVLLDRTASESFNSAQINVSEQFFGEFARILVRRRDGEGDCG
ncbi:MerR family transcriptional regulator [Collinsella tanakaei]|uniref:MerR family transcriptional regulator n=1 Tax=Collinsella tanakaei TaxID=626935 RepID=UPI0039F55344